MGETFISIPIEIPNNVTKQEEKLPKPININNEDTVDTIEDNRLNDVTEPVEKLPIDARLENADNDTIIDMEIAQDLKQETIASKLLKDIFIATDDGLRGHSENINNIEENINVPPTYLNVDHDSRWNKKPVWVQFNVALSGVEMVEESRRPFILRVFALLFVCLLLTFTFAFITFIVPGVRFFFAGAFGMMLSMVGSGMLVAGACKLMCCEYGRRCPCNVLALVSAVIACCLIFGFLSARFRLKVILLALAVTCIVVLVCLGLALTPLDFTKCYLFILVIGIAILIFSAVVFFLTIILKEYFPILHLVLCCCCIIFQSFCFIMELQLIIGGKTVELGEDHYIIGAFLLYTSVMSLFFDILRCIGILDHLDVLVDLI